MTLYEETRRELERRDTFADFVRFGRLRCRKAAGETYSHEALADLEERFS